ncbi:hypothetical protein C1645_838376 [Glomus cerebriforme]|uniref:Uncharacterized protein n=1 Tax=Glomus cerebriforme TaxID=658196 RepID=A0A397S2H9_9GLOM|nr:hypothetical protein C1645_838376 [Glomus cerebriforme]
MVIFDLILKSENWFTEFFSPEWEGKCSPSFSVQNRKGNSSLCFQFDIRIYKKCSFSFLVNSLLVRTLEIRKRSWISFRKSDSALKIEMETFGSENGNKNVSFVTFSSENRNENIQFWKQK